MGRIFRWPDINGVIHQEHIDGVFSFYAPEEQDTVGLDTLFTEDEGRWFVYTDEEFLYRGEDAKVLFQNVSRAFPDLGLEPDKDEPDKDYPFFEAEASTAQSKKVLEFIRNYFTAKDIWKYLPKEQ